MELWILLLGILTAAGVAKLFLFVARQAGLRRTLGKIPGPRETPIPLLGHASLVTGEPKDFYEKLKRVIDENVISIGREVGCVWIGPFPVLFLVGAKAAEVVMRSTEHTQKNYFYSFLHPWLQTGLVTSNAEKWHLRRRLLTPTFHFSILQDFLDIMNEHAEILTKKLEKYSDTHKAFDICKTVALCALDIICETAMGKSIHAQDLDSDYVSAVYRLTELIDHRSSAVWLWSDFVYNRTKVGKEYNRMLKIAHDFSMTMIEDRMKSSPSEDAPSKKRRLAFLDLLLDVSDEGRVLSLNDIQEEVDTFMFAGHDTTAVGLAWAMHLIGAHPDVQAKIHAELDEVFGQDADKQVNADDIKKLNYLEKVIKESLRLFPSVPWVGRTTTSDCAIDGYFVPKGTNLFVVTQMVNRNPYYWTDPDRFDPERFSQQNSVGRHPYAYVPFSAGPRNCIGQRFALMEEKVVLANVLRKYSIESADKTEDIKAVSELLLRSGGGINVRLTKRKPK